MVGEVGEFVLLLGCRERPRSEPSTFQSERKLSRDTERLLPCLAFLMGSLDVDGCMMPSVSLSILIFPIFGFSFGDDGLSQAPQEPVFDSAFAAGGLSQASQAVGFSSSLAGGGLSQLSEAPALFLPTDEAGASQLPQAASSEADLVCSAAEGAAPQLSWAEFFVSSLVLSTGEDGASQLSQAVFFGEPGS